MMIRVRGLRRSIFWPGTPGRTAVRFGHVRLAGRLRFTFPNLNNLGGLHALHLTFRVIVALALLSWERRESHAAVRSLSLRCRSVCRARLRQNRIRRKVHRSHLTRNGSRQPQLAARDHVDAFRGAQSRHFQFEFLIKFGGLGIRSLRKEIQVDSGVESSRNVARRTRKRKAQSMRRAIQHARIPACGLAPRNAPVANCQFV